MAIFAHFWQQFCDLALRIS